MRGGCSAASASAGPRDTRQPLRCPAGGRRVVEAVLALDIGTTAIKAALVAADGAILAIERAPTPSSSPQVGWLEHDPELLWAASSSVLGPVAAAAAAAGVQPRALAVTGARGTVCLIDADGRALTPFLTWQDRRSIEVLPGLRERLGGELAYYKRTGVRLDRASRGPSSFGCASMRAIASNGRAGPDDAGVRRTTPDREAAEHGFLHRELFRADGHRC